MLGYKKREEDKSSWQMGFWLSILMAVFVVIIGLLLAPIPHPIFQPWLLGPVVIILVAFCFLNALRCWEKWKGKEGWEKLTYVQMWVTVICMIVATYIFLLIVKEFIFGKTPTILQIFIVIIYILGILLLGVLLIVKWSKRK